MKEIGEKIRDFRNIRKLTVRRLAEAAETSVSMISQIENAKTNASVATLVRVADALGVTLGDLLSEGTTPSSSRVMRKADRPEVKWGSGSFKQLLTPRPFLHVEAYELELAPGDQLGELTYGDTSALVIVTSGRGTLKVGDSSEHLEQGDSASYWTSQVHAIINDGSEPFRAFLVLTPPALTSKKGDDK